MAGSLRVVFRGSSGPSVIAELASTPAERERGLMYRRTLPFDRGMLFLFPERGYPSFWMANTPLSLDILWIDTEPFWRVVDVQRGIPLDTTLLSPRSPARLALEVPSGFVETYGISAGTPVELRRS